MRFVTDTPVLQQGEPLADDVVAWFRDSVFVLGPFPQLSQTFIYREFDAMAELGLDVNVVSTRPRRLATAQLDGTLGTIQRRALYLEHNSMPVVATMGAELKSPRVRDTMRWMMTLPHRSAAKRMRAAAAVLAAAHFVPELRKRGVRYVHSHFAGFQTELAMALSRLLDVPYGCTWHAYGIYQDRNILPAKIAGARVVLTCTRHNVEHLRRICPASLDRIRLAYHGLDLRQVAEPPPIAVRGIPVILAVGRMVPSKGFLYLVRAAHLLKRRGLSFELRFIGDGPLQSKLRAQVTALGLEERVSFLGARPNEEVFAEIAGARVVVAPSVMAPDGDMDGLPNVVLEAMSMARPVVGSRLSGIPEAVAPGETGFLAEPGSAADLAEHIGVLLNDVALARRLGQHGYERVQAEFDSRKNIRQVIRHIANTN
jgi:colanic acid/amylovoran biosynthesis glycosyltransferase